MGALRLFNPENDLALAANTKNYTPPGRVRALRNAGELLPMWLSSPGDTVLVSSESVGRGIALASKFGLDVKFADRVDKEISAVEPWGWSPAVAGELERRGVPRSLLPDDVSIGRMRYLSHRRTTVALARELGFDDWSVEADSEEAALAAVDSYDGKAFVKLPWSCSGRGVFDVRELSREKLRGVIAGAIRRQGSVTVERAHSKCRDFAMLYSYSDRVAQFRGLSLFDTVGAGAYSRNLVACSDEIELILQIDATPLAARVGKALEAIIGMDYSGPVGVDMMTATDVSDGSNYVVPCVEVNLRYTMGFVAMGISDLTHRRGFLEMNVGRFVFTGVGVIL